jgi:hypothetical protein
MFKIFPQKISVVKCRSGRFNVRDAKKRAWILYGNESKSIILPAWYTRQGEGTPQWMPVCVCVCVSVCVSVRYSQMSERGRYTRKEERRNSLGLSYFTVPTVGIPFVRDLVVAVTGRDSEAEKRIFFNAVKRNVRRTFCFQDLSNSKMFITVFYLRPHK